MGWAPVELGEHTYEVIPQRIAYINDKLGSIGDLLDLDFSGDEGFILALGDNAYRLLKVFIPDLMPEWEWRGYASPTAAEQGQYDKDGDRSPTVEQIVEAFNTAMKANRLDLFQQLGKLVGADFIRSALRAQIAGSVLANSPSSSAGSTESTPGTSSTTDPTSGDESSEDSTGLSES